MKKRVIWIVIAAVLLIAVATTFIISNRNKKDSKGFEKDSVEAESEIVINSWLDALSKCDVDKLFECCYTDSLLKYHMKSVKMNEEEFRAYMAYILGTEKFEYRNVEVKGKSMLDEDAFYKINKKLDSKEQISNMYKVEFKYEIKYEEEWQEVEETCQIMLINGKCYVDNMSNGTIYDK